jgi:hypothetical protein
LVLELADVGEAFVVAVVVNEGDTGGFGGGADQEVDWWDAAMVTVGREQELQLARACP